MSNRILHKLKNEESGSIIVIVCLAVVIFLSLMALTIDIGLAYLSAGKFQKAADAAAYSAGLMLPVDQYDTTRINLIKDTAINYANLNGFSSLTRDNVVLGKIYDGRYTDITVTTASNVETNFAKTFGISSIRISQVAKAKLSPKAKITGATPIGVLTSELNERIGYDDTEHVVLKYGRGGGEHGFFGALDLDGKGGGASDYRTWIATGYPGETTVGDILLQENGNMVGPTYEGFSERYNGCTHFGATTGGTGCTIEHYDPTCPRVAKVVIYNINGSYTATVTGFASFILEAQDNDGYITGSFVNALTDVGQSTGGDAGTSGDFGFYSLMLSQ